GIVSLVIAYADGDARNAGVPVVRAFGITEHGAAFEVLHVFHAVLDEVGFLKAGELEVRHAAIEFVEHGFENGILCRVCAGGLRGSGMRRDGGEGEESRYEKRGDVASEVHWPSFVTGVDGAPGMGRIGGRCVPCCWRWVSISLTSMAGATALTGMVPDSAPHSPLKTSLLSLVARIRFIAARGVPTMLTPRTSSSGRPST